MFERLGSLTYRFRFLIVAAWVVAAVWAVLFAPSLASEGMTDQTAFLPDYTESMKAHDALEAEFPGSTSASSATLTFVRETGLTDADHAYVEDVAAWITSDRAPQGLREAVTTVDTAVSRPELDSMLRSGDGKLEMITVNLNTVLAGGAGDVVINSLRGHLASTAPAGMTANVTGAAGIGSDYLAAIEAGTESTTVVTVILVVVILLLIYRAPLAALVPLVTIGAAFVVARGTLGVLALAGWKVSSLLDTFLVVLIFGVGTDYAIFLISRFREEVAKGDWHDASRVTVRRIGAVISASAATVIVGLGAMAFGDFGMIQTTGPALAVGIFVTLIAGLTLAPALLGIFGHYLFWPLHTRPADDGEPGGFFARLADGVARRPGVVTVVLLVVLIIPWAAIPSMKTNFDVLTELPADSDARAGFDQVATHLGRGKVFQSTGIVMGGPDTDLLQPARLAQLLDTVDTLGRTAGVSSVTSLLTPEGDGVLPDGFRPSYQLAETADSISTDSAGGTPSDSKSLSDSSVSDGLETATTYMTLLGDAYPDVAAGAPYRAVMAGLAKAQDQVDSAREAAVLSTQLRSLAGAMTSPAAAAGGDSTESILTIGDYLDELAAAYPEVKGMIAFADAKAAVASLEKKTSLAAALDLADALERLAVHFEDRPDATFFPTSLADTAEAQQTRREVEATFKQLPVDLDALAAVFAARADDIFLPVGIGGEDGADLQEAVDAFVSKDRAAMRFYVATTENPYSETGFAAVRRAQDVLTGAAPGFGAGAEAHLGGTTAQFADVKAVLASDMEKVAIITVLGILLVLMLLLRAIIAPLYLVGTVLLSYGTALGLSSWLFESVMGHGGISFYLPILLFVLLVSLGSDYNIFLMSRVREESEGRPIRDGIRIASGRTGAVITSAGLILAGTFGSMATAPLVILFQVGVAVAIGVLIDTFLVRSILVPAITMLFGERAWWPSGPAGASIRRWWPVVVPAPVSGQAVAPATSRRRLSVALGLVALVPVLFAGLLAWAANDPRANLAAVNAAVVNLDQGATIAAPDGSQQRIALGAEIADRLTSGTERDTFSWLATDAAAASDGLADGRYGAVLTIPADFSAAAAAIIRDGQEATRPRLRLETNDATSYELADTARSIVAAIAASTATDVTSNVVDRVLVEVNDARDAVAGAAGRADRVASGSAGLVDRARDTSATAEELVAGLEEIADGVSSSDSGMQDLAAAVDKLADGTGSLAAGAASLRSGARAAATGAGGVADGAASLADGLGQLSAMTADLPAQVAALATGANGVSDGASGVAAGARSLADGLAALEAGTAGFGDQAASLDEGAAGLDSGARSLAAGAGASADAAAELATGARALSTSVSGYTDAVAQLSASCAALGGTDPLCAQLAALAATNDQLTGGAAAVAAGATGLAAGSADLAGGARELAAGADALHAGTAQLAASAPALEAGVAESASGAGSLAAGASDLATGASALDAGLATFAASVPALSEAIADSASGAGQLADGADSVAAGMTKLARGADGLTSGARAAAAGASRLADGTSTAADGASKLADGMGEAADAARLVAEGVDDLAGDGQSVTDDATSLATGLQDDAAAIPTYTDADRQALGSVAGSPVSVESSRLNAVASSGAGQAPLFMALGLWLGALAIFLVVPALLGRLDRRRWWIRAFAGFGAGAVIGVVQALLMVLVLRFAIGIEVARLPELFACSVLASLAFVAVNQAFVALFDYRGWIAALLFTALQLAAVGLAYPVETAPTLLRLLHPVLPMTCAVDAFRALVSGGSALLVPAMVGLAAWLVGSLVVTMAVAWRSAETPDDGEVEAQAAGA